MFPRLETQTAGYIFYAFLFYPEAMHQKSEHQKLELGCKTIKKPTHEYQKKHFSPQHDYVI